MIKSTYNRGFVLAFTSGFSISVQITGKMDNKADMKIPIVESRTATVTIFFKDKALVIDDKASTEYQTAEQVALWIQRTAEAEKPGDILKYFHLQLEQEWE